MARFHSKRWAIVLVFVALVSMLVLTDPTRLPLPLIIVPFLLLFSLIYLLISSLLSTRSNMKGRRSVIISGVTALVPTLLIMFQSIHQLTARDVLVVIGLAAATAFYIAKADFIS